MTTLQPSALRAGLRQNHRKVTRARQAVLDILAHTNRHLTPAEIYRQAQRTYPQLGLTTVYRTLDLLVELGYLQRVHATDGCHSYALCAQAHSHQLICVMCGRTEEFSTCDLDALVRALQRKTGFEINVHVLELAGYCPTCRTKPRAVQRRTRRRKS